MQRAASEPRNGSKKADVEQCVSLYQDYFSHQKGKNLNQKSLMKIAEHFSNAYESKQKFTSSLAAVEREQRSELAEPALLLRGMSNSAAILPENVELKRPASTTVQDISGVVATEPEFANLEQELPQQAKAPDGLTQSYPTLINIRSNPKNIPIVFKIKPIPSVGTLNQK